MVDTQYLEQKISDSGLKKSFIAEKLGIGVTSLYNKINGITDFTVNEANNLLILLNCNNEKERKKIFKL